MARPRKLLGTMNKNLTKEEIEKREEQESRLYEFEHLDMDDVPQFLHSDERAVIEWRRIIPLMSELPISELDRQTMAQYCKYVSVYEQASEGLIEQGILTEEGKENPLFNVMVKASKELKSITSAMGLNINSRMKIVTPETVEDDTDPFEKMYKEKDN